MGFLERLFPGKKRHARGNPTDDDTDPFSHTRVLRPDARDAPARDPWGEPSGGDPFGVDAPADAPTELRVPDTEFPPRREPEFSRPSPATLPPVSSGRRTPFAPHTGSDNDDETVLGDTIGAVRTGRVLGVLIAIDGPLDGFVARIVEGKNTLGRDGYPDPIPKQEATKGISRVHATLEAEVGGVVIEPASDRNAVFVNDNLVDHRTLLSHGDRIRLGMKQPLTLVLLLVP